MSWPVAIKAVITALEADPVLGSIEGLSIYRHGEFTAPKVPGIAWIIVSDLKAENTNPIRVQLDVFARGLEQARAIEERLRAILDRDVPQTLQGVLMRTDLLDAQDQLDPEPGVTHRSLDFLFEPTRGAAL